MLCSPAKKKEEATELSKLPAATQTGANTIGCLVNGRAFLPKTPSLSSLHPYQCNYQYINGGYYLLVEVNDQEAVDDLYGIDINTNFLSVAEGQSYDLKTYGTTKTAYASYVHFYGASTIDNYKTNTSTGKLTITKLDLVKQIISGAFFFNAVNIKGDTVKVTDGRFDMHYTQ